MGQDIAPDDHIEQLKMDLYRFTNDLNFKMPKRMGNVLSAAFKFITKITIPIYLNLDFKTPLL
jgi:hypothetical protein